MNAVFAYVFARLKEPSTYAGFAGIALALGISAPEWAVVSQVAIAIFSGLAVVVPAS
jgi:hypothetical protein